MQIYLYVWVRVSIWALSIAAAACAAEAACPPRLAPPPSEWPVASVTIEQSIEENSTDLTVRFLLCVSRSGEDEGPSNDPSPDATEATPEPESLELSRSAQALRPRQVEPPQTDRIQNAPRRSWYLELGLSGPERARAPHSARAISERSPRMDVGARRYHVPARWVNRESHLVFYVGGHASVLFGDGVDFGGAARIGFEYRPTLRGKTGPTLDVGIRYDTLKRFLVNDRGTRFSVGVRIPLKR